MFKEPTIPGRTVLRCGPLLFTPLLLFRLLLLFSPVWWYALFILGIEGKLCVAVVLCKWFCCSGCWWVCCCRCVCCKGRCDCEWALPAYFISVLMPIILVLPIPLLTPPTLV